MKETRVGYLGPKGATFGWRVAEAYAQQGVLVPMKSHIDIIQAIGDGRLDEGIVGIENRCDGAVTETTRAVWRDGKGIRVIGELRTSVVLYCLQHPDGMWPPRIVKSYAAVFGQCRAFLSELASAGIGIEHTSSTGAAAQEAVGDPTIAAIASELAADSCGLVKRKVVSDDPRNQTRFLVVAPACAAQPKATGNDRTTVLLRLANVPGGLHQITGVFAAPPAYNLTLLHYDPVEGEFGDYVFWLDVSGHCDESRLRSCLDQLGHLECVQEVRCLGSYPATNSF